MNRRFVLLAAFAVLGTGQAYAQEPAARPGTVEITAIPGGGTFFTSGDHGPSFGSYNLGGAAAYNFNRFVGIEGEVGGNFGRSQDLDFATGTINAKTPNQLNYSANVIVSAPTGTSVVPYVGGGVGGLTLFEQASVGVTSNETFLTGNVGGGLKWYAPNGRWGLRGDYRFLTVRSNDSAPASSASRTRLRWTRAGASSSATARTTAFRSSTRTAAT